MSSRKRNWFAKSQAGFAGQTVRPYLDYVGGIAEATMMWDGRSFQNIQFATNDAASLRPPPTLPPFARPTEVSDAAVLAAVTAGFSDCASLSVPRPPRASPSPTAHSSSP